VHEGLVLRHRESGGQFFVVHGHQGDLMSDRLWRFSRLNVRYLWRNLQLLGFNDPTSPAQNFRRRNEVEQHLIDWARHNRQPMICGHTHRSVLPAPDEAPYFNTGSAVHPRCITGLEIEAGEICLIKWWLAPDDEGRLCVTREVLAGPHSVRAYF
jgi:UDP-2,3-diacylglucosamine pyrophosphatase LpxH